jgi:serine/threonine protein kinase
MPPEQFGGQTTPASDLYALGATIICLATGQHPSELPYRDMRIDFVDALSRQSHPQVNLSVHLTKWLKSMTESNVDLRLKSATQALNALNLPNQENILSIYRQPFGSRIKLNKTARIFEISIPPKSFPLDWAVKFCLAVACSACLLWPISAGLVTSNSGILTMLLYFINFVLFEIGITLILTSDLLITQKLRIDESEISLFSVIFGLRCPASTAPRQYLDRVELVPLTFAISDYYSGRVVVPPYINIWAGNKQFCLNNFNLTQPEREWLICELTEWLDLPN